MQDLLALEYGFAFLQERANALLVIIAVVNVSAETLEPLESLGALGTRLGEDPQLFLQERDAQWRSLGDLGGDLPERKPSIREPGTTALIMPNSKRPVPPRSAAR